MRVFCGPLFELIKMSKDILIGEKYKMSRAHKLGSGSFGEIYLGKELSEVGINLKSNNKVAVKLVRDQKFVGVVASEEHTADVRSEGDQNDAGLT